jgi:ABC-type Fe3+-hydroxamate transport system substrate-binding protein
MTRVLASLLVLGLVLVSPAFAADSTKTAKGTVKTVAADSVTVTDSAGKDWTFAVDNKTKVIASGGSHKTAETKAAGKTPLITDVVKTGASVVVKYHEMDGGKMHAASVRVM